MSTLHKLARAGTFLAAGLVLATTPVLAQIADGNIVGTVMDISGAVIAGARVEAMNEATGVKWETSSDGAGQYRINSLQIGSYRITASAGGFQTTSVSAIPVELSKTSTANVRMQAGTVTTTLDLVETAPLLDTTTTQIANIYATRIISDLPLAANLNGGYINLSLLSAGVASGGGVGNGTGPSVGGNRTRNNNFTLEGSDNNRKDITGPVVTVPTDAVAEFTLLQNQFSAEFGHSSGGQFNAVIRSGGNEVHGRAYEYFMNRNLNALDAFQRRSGYTSPPRYDENLVGGFIGGPVKKDTLFFLGGFDYNPQGFAAFSSVPAYVPTAEGYTLLRSIPGVSQTNIDVLEKYMGAAPEQDGDYTTPVAGTAIPLGVSRTGVTPAYNNIYRWIASADYNIGTNDQLRGRYINNLKRGINTRAQAPAFYTTRPTDAHLASISEFHTFSPTLFNEFRVAYNRLADRQIVPDESFPGLDAFPNIIIRNDLFLNLGPGDNAPQTLTQNVYQLADNLSWNKGTHDFRFGFDGRVSIAANDMISAIRGTYTYRTLARYALDQTPDVDARRANGSKPYIGNSTAFYLYANDNWRVTRRLTVNLGLRWEYNGIARSMKEFDQNKIADVPGVIEFRAPEPQLTAFAPRVGFAYSPGDDAKTVIRGGFGLAYDQIFDNIGQILRPPQAASVMNLTGANIPNFLASGGINGSMFPPPHDQAGARANSTFWIPDQTLGYAITWNFGVQRILGNQYVVDVRYVGTKGVHLLLQTQLNRYAVVDADYSLPTYLSAPSQAELDALPLTLNDLQARRNALSNPLAGYGFSQPVTAYTPQGNSEYHGLAIDLSKRLAGGLMLKGGYTWSHLMDDSTAETSTTVLTPRRPQDYNNLRQEWASSSLDRRHRLTMAWTWDSPAFRGANWFLRNVAGNYTFSGIYTVESAQYVTPQSGFDANLNQDAVADRTILNPNGVKGTSSPVTALTNSEGRVVAYLANNPNAQYISAGAGALATAGRNTLATPRINNFDLSVGKAFALGEQRRLEFRGDFYNALNHAQYTPGRINNALNSVTTGTAITGAVTAGTANFGRWDQVFASNSRWVQLVAKFSF